jgi:hypothetical protein
MPRGCQGTTEADVNDADDDTLLKTPTRGTYGLAIAISFGFHMLILWVVTRYLFDDGNMPMPAKPRTIHLTLSYTQSRRSDPVVPRPVLSTTRTDEVKTTKDETSRKMILNGDDRLNPPPGKGTTKDPKVFGDSTLASETQGSVSASQIMASAKTYAQRMATEDTTQVKQEDSAIRSALKRAFNPHREPPGVTSLADGTIRVITPFGTTYCIKPRDDSRILGPEDDMPVSMTCR